MPKKKKARLSNHKPRGRWCQSRSAWPKREAPVHTLMRERERANKSLPHAMTGAQWVCVGPTNIGGRITSLICHPTRPENIWIGAAGGGVWRSKNAGKEWKMCWNDQDILNIGSPAIEEKKTDGIYCWPGHAQILSEFY